MKRFLTSVSLQHDPKVSDVITLVKKTFLRTSIVRNFISRRVKMRSDIKILFMSNILKFFLFIFFILSFFLLDRPRKEIL